MIQVYEGLVYMDFDKGLFEKQGHGDYVPLSVSGNFGSSFILLSG